MLECILVRGNNNTHTEKIMSVKIDKSHGTVKQKDVNRAHNMVRDALDLLYELRDMAPEDGQTDIYLSKVIVPLAEAQDKFMTFGPPR